MAAVTIIFGGLEQKTHLLDSPRMVVGRDPACEIHIDNLGISRQHCAFSARGEAFVVQDLNSSNGTYVNGKKITEHFLNNADEVVIGKYVLRFLNNAQVVASPPPPDPVSGVPDNLNTYVMDGAKIQEQLAKMRAEKGFTAAPAAGVAAGATAGAIGATAKDYAKALDPGSPAPASEAANLKKVLYALGAVVLVLLIGLILVLFKVIPI